MAGGPAPWNFPFHVFISARFDYTSPMNPGPATALTAQSLLRWLLAFFLISLFILLACSFIGQYPLNVEWSPRFWQWSLWHSEIWHARLYRLAAAAVVGSALAVAGMTLQGLLRNPLADPYVLGISSGAGLGVLLAPALSGWILLPGWAVTPALSLLGAILTSILGYTLAQRHGRLDPFVLLLSGVIVNNFNGALILAILQFVKQTEMINFIGWGMGRIPEWLWFKPGLLLACSLLILLSCSLLFFRAAALNTLGLGEEVAASSGVTVHRLRIEAFILIALMTSAAVSLAGPIGFVGLIVPHIARLLFGPDHRKLTIINAFAGAIFLMIADPLCRFIGQTQSMGELPVGVITAVLGGPVFILLLRKNQKQYIP